MAVKRFLEKPKTFEFEGVLVGVRQPNVAEMLEITRERQAYLKTVKDDVYGDGEGEVGLFLELQKNTSQRLACDPDDAQNPWFAADEEEQKRLKMNGVEKDLASEVPFKFHQNVWNVLTGIGGSAPLEKAETSPESATTDSEITSNSTPSLSESGSISGAQSGTSSSGNGSDSSTESPA